MVPNTLKPKKLADQVFERIRDLIFKGDLRPGEQLKSERELSDILSVSRPTIRQAIRKLIELGLIENRQGQGTYICNPKEARGHNMLREMIDWGEASLRDLLEVRMALECQAATSAALRATAADVASLEQHVDDMHASIQNGELGILEDVRFHMTLAYATKNQVQIMLMKNLYDLLHFGIEESLKQLYLEPKNLETILIQHKRVCDAIRRRDPDSAYDAMRRHITFLINFMCDESRMLKQVSADPAGKDSGEPAASDGTVSAERPSVEQASL
jgi:GntR family transcriptional regulator, transcriptional repressor for pyruvate dehydrogenase complex